MKWAFDGRHVFFKIITIKSSVHFYIPHKNFGFHINQRGGEEYSEIFFDDGTRSNYYQLGALMFFSNPLFLVSVPTRLSPLKGGHGTSAAGLTALILSLSLSPTPLSVCLPPPFVGQQFSILSWLERQRKRGRAFNGGSQIEVCEGVLGPEGGVAAGPGLRVHWQWPAMGRTGMSAPVYLFLRICSLTISFCTGSDTHILRCNSRFSPGSFCMSSWYW